MWTKTITENKFVKLELNYEPRNGFVSLCQTEYKEGNIKLVKVIGISPVEMRKISQTLGVWENKILGYDEEVDTE